MRIKHHDLQFAAAAVLAAGLLTACSGGGSGSASVGGPAPGAPDSPGIDPSPGAVPQVPDEEGVVVLPLFTDGVATRNNELRSNAVEELEVLGREWRESRTVRLDNGNYMTLDIAYGYEQILADFDREIHRAQRNLHSWRLYDDLRGAFPCDPRPSGSNCQAQEDPNTADPVAARTFAFSVSLNDLQGPAVRLPETWRTGALDPDTGLRAFVIPPAFRATEGRTGVEIRLDDLQGATQADANAILLQLFRGIGEHDRVAWIQEQTLRWQNAYNSLTEQRAAVVAWYERVQREIRVDTGRHTAQLRDAQAVRNALAGARTPATPQDGQRFARVYASARRTGAALEFDTAGNDIDSAAGDAVFFDPHGTPDEQAQYRVRTSGAVNANQDIVPRGGLLYRSATALLPMARPPSSDRSVIWHGSADSGRFPARGTVFRGGVRGAAARVVQDGDNLAADSAGALRRRLQVQGDASDREADGTADDAYAWQDWHAAPFSTFRYDTANGWSMGFGGSGVVFADLMRYAAKPEGASSTLAANQANDDVANNIEIWFGDRPAGYAGLDPHIPAFYWNLKTPSLRRDAAGNLVDDAHTPNAERFDGGRYELLLTSYAGRTSEISAPADGMAHRFVWVPYRDENGDPDPDHPDRLERKLEITELEAGLTEAEKAAQRAEGIRLAQVYAEERAKLDPELYLKHAAYGLFAFTSRFGGAEAVERLQTFHFGRQAFVDEAGNRVSDIAGVNGIVGSKYYGRTMGWLLTSVDAGDKSADGSISGRHRIRGDVELHLDIFGTGFGLDDPGAIVGEISNLQIEAAQGRWSTSGSDVLGTGTAAALRGTISLNALGGYFADGYDLDNLNEDGTYDGAAVPMSPVDENTLATLPGIAGFFGEGEFEGALYGRKTRIPETAGTWWVPARLEFAGAEGMIGSFGAFCGEQLGCSPAGPDILPDP